MWQLMMFKIGAEAEMSQTITYNFGNYLENFYFQKSFKTFISIMSDYFENIWKNLKKYLCLTINETYQMIKPCRNHHIFGSWMPFNMQNLSFMSSQLHHALSEIRCESAFWDLPNSNGAIIRSWRNQVIVKRIPFQIQNLPAMSDYFAYLKVNATRLKQYYMVNIMKFGKFK